MKKHWLYFIGVSAGLTACKTTDWAKECSERFPVKEQTTYKHSESITLDTSVEMRKTFAMSLVLCPPTDTPRLISLPSIVECPTIKVREQRNSTDTVEVFKTPTAEIALLAKENEKLKDAYARADAKNGVYERLFYVFLILFILSIVINALLLFRRNGK